MSPNRIATIDITWSPTLPETARRLARALPGDLPPSLPLVASSLRRDDRLLVAVRTALRGQGRRSTVVLPRPPVSVAASLVANRSRPAWRAVPAEGRTWRVDARLEGGGYVSVTLVDAARRTGPFALDLPSRFLHPADRLRLAASADRLRLLADIAAPTLPAACLIATCVDGGWLGLATADPIAAELWALALAERYHDAALEMQGPWEEATVQRATELGLGVRIPVEMELRVDIDPDASGARALLGRTAARLGIAVGQV